MDENIRVVEINGIKVEVDLRTCKIIENYKVGDPVKVLIKSYSDYKSYPGVIIGFDDFQQLPTLIVAYLDSSYSSADVKFVYINSQTKDTEICPSNKLDRFLDQNHALDLLDRNIESKKREVTELESKRKYFLNQFQTYFKEVSL